MAKMNRTAGVFFAATVAVYAAWPNGANGASGANPGTNVTWLEAEMADAAPASTQPAATSQPAAAPTVGTSVADTDVNVSAGGTVEIHVNDASLVEVLRMLSLRTQKNIIASKEVRGNITANLYDVTVREALDAILHSNGFAYREKGNFIYIYSTRELAEIEKSERKTVTATYHLYYTPAGNAVNLIKPVLSADAEVAFTTPALSGLDSGTKSIGGNDHATDDLIVVTDYPENLTQVAKVLKEVDQRPQQILIEATILRATLNENNKLGVDFAVVGGVDFSTLTGANTAEAAVGTGFDQTLDGRIIRNKSAAAGNAMDHGVIAGTVGGGGLQMGVIKNNVGVFVSALEGITDTVVMANPKILALNKQKGEVIVGSKNGYLTTTLTDSASVQTVEFLETGTRLIFRPYIGDDGYIRMEIHPEDSTGGVDDKGLPSKQTTEVTSNVMVKDGHTIVIGGLFREQSASARSQTPFLGNLPVVGALFRQQSDSTVREEVIILLTPHIVHDQLAYANLSATEMARAEQLRLGVRKGMMPWGRERLAEIQYNAAREELAKPDGNRCRALWHLNAATNLNPQFGEAIELKQRVTGRVLAGADNSSIRSFVQRAILADLPAVQGGEPATRPADGSPTTAPATLGGAADAGEPDGEPVGESGGEPAGAAANMPPMQAAPTTTANGANSERMRSFADDSPLFERPLATRPAVRSLWARIMNPFGWAAAPESRATFTVTELGAD